MLIRSVDVVCFSFFFIAISKGYFSELEFLMFVCSFEEGAFDKGSLPMPVVNIELRSFFLRANVTAAAFND